MYPIQSNVTLFKSEISHLFAEVISKVQNYSPSKDISNQEIDNLICKE